MEVTPALVLSMWSAGMAAGAAVVSSWGVVGSGFNWLLSGIVVIVGGATALAGNVTIGLAACAAALAAGVMARRRPVAAWLFALSALGYLVTAISDGGVIPAITGSVFLGGMTTEMLLGHWFLIDPTLPRSAL